MTMKMTLSGAKSVQQGTAHKLASDRAPRTASILIYGSAIKRQTKFLKAWTRDRVKSTVEGAAKLGGPDVAHNTGQIYGPAIRKPGKPLKIRLRDRVRSTVSGATRLTKNESRTGSHPSRVTGHKSRLTSHEGFLLRVPVLINGPAIGIPRKLLKTRLRDHVRSTVKGVYESRQPSTDFEPQVTACLLPAARETNFTFAKLHRCAMLRTVKEIDQLGRA
jgi:hypothetical protein